MRLDGLYLPFELRDFGPEETRSYLARSGEQKNTQAFAELPQLVEAIDRVTHGLPLFLAIAVDAVVEAGKRKRQLLPADFERIE